MKQIVGKVLKKIENVFKIKNSKMSKRQLKLIIPAAVCLFVFVVAIGGRVMLSSLTTNIYSISDLNGNIDNLKAGDIINYNINGYSDWKVLSVDKNNGTVEVTSNTNVKDLTIEPYKTVDEYNQLFQTEANKFLDNKYVVSARTINKADSLTFDSDSDEEYWLANVNENTLMTNKNGEGDSSTIWTKATFDFNEIYIVPYIGVTNPYDYIPDVGSELEFESNGITHWIYSGQTSSYGDDGGKKVLLYIPAYPVSLPINSMEDIGRVSLEYFESFNTNNIRDFGNYLSKFPNNFHGLMIQYESKNVFDNVDKTMYFVSGIGGGVKTADQKYNIKKGYSAYDTSGTGGSSYDNNCAEGGSSGIYDYYDGFYRCDIQIYKFVTSDLNSSKPSKDVSIFYEPKTLTFGYKPVLTLKIDNGKTGVDLSDNLKIGDYVNYEANGYKNWRVLSIDKDEGFVEVISGGIVKNLSLYGKSDYDDYENILQREVDLYKVGNNAVGARAISENDIDLLKKMDDKVDAFYWFNKKTQRRLTQRFLDETPDLYSGTIAKEATLDVGVLKYTSGNYNLSYPVGYWVRLYSNFVNESDDIVNYSGNGDLNYIAGLRPIIKLKYSTVEKLSPSEYKSIVSKSNKNDSNLYKAQQSKNRYSKISIISGSDDNSGTGSDYYDYESMCNNSFSCCNNINTINIGTSNNLLRWLFIILFVYGVVFAFFVMLFLIHIIKKRII